MKTRHATVTLPSDTEILITRDFDAPRELVFEVLSTPAHLRHWYGPAQHELTECDIDLRVGGRYRYVTRLQQGGEIAFSGEFLDVDAPARLVYTEIFESMPDSPSTVTSTLDERDGRTTLTLHSSYACRADRDTVIESGMESGMQESYDRVDAVLASLR